MNIELVRNVCLRYGVRSVTLSQATGVVDDAEAVCNITLDFDDDYRVQFKLPAHATPFSEGVVAMSAGGEVTLEEGRDTVSEETLSSFFRDIESRLDKIQHEQDVQNITYLGNTFVLNNKTVFDVIADDEGRLTIDMHRGDTRQQAMLLASSLLDGLYDGSIVLKSEGLS
jgi:hypothetical protein